MLLHDFIIFYRAEQVPKLQFVLGPSYPTISNGLCWQATWTEKECRWILHMPQTAWYSFCQRCVASEGRTSCQHHHGQRESKRATILFFFFVKLFFFYLGNCQICKTGPPFPTLNAVFRGILGGGSREGSVSPMYREGCQGPCLWWVNMSQL